MSIQLQVRWPNPGHELLSKPKIQLLVDEADTPPTSVQQGRWQFEIPDGSAHVLLKVEFVPTLPLKAGLIDFVVLQADQAYIVEGTTLHPDPTPFRLVNGEMIAQNVHPLIDLVSAGNAVAGLATAEVRTEFVDVTQVWKTIVNRDLWDVYEVDKEREVMFVAVAATGSTPPLWFAAFPMDLEPPSSDVGTLVFFRPSVDKSYNAVREADPMEVQFGLSRYLLAPRHPDDPFILRGEPLPRGEQSGFQITGEWFALRCSFQRALIRSGKPVVMLHPWPQGGTQFGDASSAKLPHLTQGILRLLRGAGYVGANHPEITPGRMGLSGYSAGGPSTIAAFRANRHLVRELYLFDPVQLATGAPHVIQWATKTDDFRLRMTGASSWPSVKGIYESVKKSVGPEAAELALTARPMDPSAWDTEANGGWRWWNYMIEKKPQYRYSWEYQHQFVVFGGEEFEMSDGRVVHYTTFLEDFLKGSGY